MTLSTFFISVADPGFLSRIPDPDFYPSHIPDPRSNNSTKRGRGKKKIFPTIFCNPNYHKILHNFIIEQVKKFFSAKTQRIIVLFTDNFVIGR
jgi:hypothetical protein